MTTVDPYRERNCKSCGKLYRPSTNTPSRAALSEACSHICAGLIREAKHAQGRPIGRLGSACRELDPIDLTPCARCGLRGHLAGDPDRCTSGVEMYGHADGGGEYVGRRQR